MFEKVKDHPFVKDLEPQFAAVLEELAHSKAFSSGTQLFREGDRADHLYLITVGTVAIQAYAPGRGSSTIDTASEGDFVGWAWLVEPYRAHYDAVAHTDVECFEINADLLREKCEADHELGYRMYRRIVEVMEHRLQNTRLILLDVYKKGGR